MATMINRLFTRTEPNSSVTELEEDEKLIFLNSLLEKGSSNSRLRSLAASVDDLVFSETAHIAELQLVQKYLEIENYLIYHDPRYINSEIKLREEIKVDFPILAIREGFASLYADGKTQEIFLNNYFLKFLLHSFVSENKSKLLASKLLAAHRVLNEPKTGMRLVDQINLLRQAREKSQNIYNELSEHHGQEWVKDIYAKCHKEFSLYHKDLKRVKCIDDLLPEHNETYVQRPQEGVIKLINTKPDKKVNLQPQVSEKTILENILDGYVLFDRKGRIIDYNSKVLEIFNVTKYDILIRSLFTLLPEGLVTDLVDDLENTNPLITKKIIGTRREVKITRGKNGAQDYELMITNNYTEGQDTFSIFLRNISTKKDTLKAISDAKLNAERMAKAKTTFLSNMSHEIRTPLNVILGLSEIISKEDFTDKELLKTNLEGIDFSAQNLLSIVNDILDFSKIEAGKLSIQAIDFNLRKVVANLNNGFAIKAEEKGLILETHIEEDVPNIVIGDQYRLNQVLTNLIGNAIKFTQKGKVSINVKLASQDEEDIIIGFEVKDTGIGIAKDKLTSIFDSFYQVENPDSSKVNGTGLGLAITKELIQLQNGILKADSLVGIGSIFEFTIPLKKSKLKKIVQFEKNIKRVNKKLNGLKVLVAEDNKMNQFYIKQLLAGLHVDIDIAENGADAVDKYNNSGVDYDLILMDMHMPIMNGVEAISIIRKSNKDSLRKVPIVACSADVFPEARKNAIKAGIDFYLTKPLNEDAIKEVLYWLIADEDTLTEKPLDIDLVPEDENTPKSSHVDINRLKETFDNDLEFISSLLEVFIKDTPEEYTSLRKCLDREFYARASSLAHKMKSSFMNLGMTLHGHHLQLMESNLTKKDGVEKAKKHFAAFTKLYHKALLEVSLLLIEMKQK